MTPLFFFMQNHKKGGHFNAFQNIKRNICFINVHTATVSALWEKADDWSELFFIKEHFLVRFFFSPFFVKTQKNETLGKVQLKLN